MILSRALPVLVINLQPLQSSTVARVRRSGSGGSEPDSATTRDQGNFSGSGNSSSLEHGRSPVVDSDGLMEL